MTLGSQQNKRSRYDTLVSIDLLLCYAVCSASLDETMSREMESELFSVSNMRSVVLIYTSGSVRMG